MLVGLGGYTMLWEPMHYDDWDAIASGISWPNYVAADDTTNTKLSYAESLLRGDLLHRRPHLPTFSLRELLVHRGYVIKFVDGNLALNWLVRSFPIRPMLLVRHPCSVVLSQHRHWAWKNYSVERNQLPRILGERYPHLRDVHASVKTRFQALAFTWAVQLWVTLREGVAPLRYALMSYEELRADPHRGLQAFLEFAGHSSVGLSSIDAAKPSWTTTQDSALKGGRESGWQRALSTPEIEEIMGVVQAVGIELYDGASTQPHWGRPGRGLEHVSPWWRGVDAGKRETRD